MTTASGNRFSNLIHSIRFRLTLWTIAVLAVILAAFSIFIYIRQARDLQIQAQNNLVVKAQQIQIIFRSALVGEPDGEAFQPPPLAGNGTVTLDQGQTLALVAPDGRLFQSAGGVDTTLVKKLASYWQQTSQSNDPIFLMDTQLNGRSHGWLPQHMYLITPLIGPRHWVGLLIMDGKVDPTGLLPRLLATLFLGSLATLLFALLGGYWIASRAMAPVRVITRAAQSISDTDLHRRLNLTTRDELGELAKTFDAMLARLETAFDRQRQFTADASHELRTPLTIVGLETDHALEKLRSVEEYERALTVIHSENEFMSRLVNDLLVLARIDAGQTHFRPEPLDLSDLALDVIDRLAPLAAHTHTQLLSGELPNVPIQGDRQYLTQMLTNLVENAIKYAGGGDGQVRIETGTLPAGNMGWVLIEDNGPGIPEEDLPHIFDRFYRVDKARKRSDETQKDEADNIPDGSGLGLSIVQSIARGHGGDILVESQAGKGTRFEIRLPVDRQRMNGRQPIPEKSGLKTSQAG